MGCCRDTAGLAPNLDCSSHASLGIRAATFPGPNPAELEAALLSTGAMPFGHHHQSSQNDPAAGIYAAASALGSA